MKRFLTATITAALMLPGVAMADLTPEDMAKADKVRDARTAVRLAFQTKASKVEFNKAVKLLDKKVPGRDCDSDDALLTCEMEDGRSISAEAVRVNLSKAEAADLCTNPYADGPEEIEVELKGDPKRGFLMLWCTTKARDWSIKALTGSAQAGPELFNKNTTTNKKVAAYNQGYATAAAGDVCFWRAIPLLKVLDEDVRQAISNSYINNPKLEAHWQRGHDDANAQGMAALDREDGLAIDAICSKAQKLPLMKGLFKWLDDAPFHGYAEICREDPVYYMCPHSRQMIEQIKRDLLNRK